MPYGTFDHTLLTKEWTPLDPGVVDNKYYAQCIGMVREVAVKGGSEESVLVDFKTAEASDGSEDSCDDDGNNHVTSSGA